MIFIDTNVFYNTFFDTKFSNSARRFIDQNHKLVTSSTVIHELILVSAYAMRLQRSQPSIGTLEEFTFWK